MATKCRWHIILAVTHSDFWKDRHLPMAVKADRHNIERSLWYSRQRVVGRIPPRRRTCQWFDLWYISAAIISTRPPQIAARTWRALFNYDRSSLGVQGWERTHESSKRAIPLVIGIRSIFCKPHFHRPFVAVTTYRGPPTIVRSRPLLCTVNKSSALIF